LFRHGGLTEGADSDLSDAELCADEFHPIASLSGEKGGRTKRWSFSSTRAHPTVRRRSSHSAPTRCPNACITARHRPVWTRAADDAGILLREKRLSELQRVALRRDLDRIEAVLDGITKPASPDPLARSSPIQGSQRRAAFISALIGCENGPCSCSCHVLS
jgi:hypothetical protein